MSHEAYAFLLAVGCGFFAVALLGARNAIDRGLFLSILLDICWWGIVSVMFVYCMWQSVAFEVRLFQIIGVGIGALLAHFTVQKLFNTITKWFLTVIFKLLLTPWTFLYKIIIVPICRAVRSDLRKVADNDSPKGQDC